MVDELESNMDEFISEIPWYVGENMANLDPAYEPFEAHLSKLYVFVTSGNISK